MTRLLQAVRFERDAYVWMDFNDRATGDALLLVAATRILLLLGFGFSVLGLTTSLSGIEILLTTLINAAVFWLVYSGLVHAAARFLFEGEGSYATTLRITGFAHPTLLLLIATVNLVSNPLIALILGSLWFLVVVGQGVRHTADLPIERALAAAAAGLIGWIIVSSIFGRGLI